MLRTAEETALVIAVIFKRSGQTRARMGANTIRLASGRAHLRGAFMTLLVDALAQYGVGIIELATGGFGLIQTKALEAAKSVTARKQLSEDEKERLRTGRNLQYTDFEDELGTDEDGSEYAE